MDAFTRRFLQRGYLLAAGAFAEGLHMPHPLMHFDY